MVKKNTLLITGANGFIGYGAVLFFANLPEYEVIATVRKKSSNQNQSPMTKELNLDIEHKIKFWKPIVKNGWWMNHVIGFSVRYWFRTTLDRDKLEATKKKNRIQVKVDTGDKIDE